MRRISWPEIYDALVPGTAALLLTLVDLQGALPARLTGRASPVEGWTLGEAGAAIAWLIAIAMIVTHGYTKIAGPIRYREPLVLRRRIHKVLEKIAALFPNDDAIRVTLFIPNGDGLVPIVRFRTDAPKNHRPNTSVRFSVNSSMLIRKAWSNPMKTIIFAIPKHVAPYDRQLAVAQGFFQYKLEMKVEEVKKLSSRTLLDIRWILHVAVCAYGDLDPVGLLCIDSTTKVPGMKESKDENHDFQEENDDLAAKHVAEPLKAMQPYLSILGGMLYK